MPEDDNNCKNSKEDIIHDRVARINQLNQLIH